MIMKASKAILTLCMALLVTGVSYAGDKDRKENHHRQSAYNVGTNPGKNKLKDKHRPGGTSSHKNHNSHYGNSNNGKPGNHVKPDKGHHGHNKPISTLRPGGNSHPGRPNRPMRPSHAHSQPRPGAHMRPSWYHPSGYRYNDALRNMIYRAVGRGRYRNVWMVSPGVYVVSYILGPNTYYQYLYPERGAFGQPIQMVYNEPGGWYAYNDQSKYFYEDGNVLRISLNGVPQAPWALVPSINLNLHF